MKKILSTIILLSLFVGTCFAGPAPTMRTTATNTRVIGGYEFVQLEGINVPAYAGVTPSAITVYADNIAGFSSIDFYVTGVSTGSAITTMSAQAVYSDGSAVTTAQTITSGTDLTDLKSGYYKFIIPAASVTRNVSFNILIAD